MRSPVAINSASKARSRSAARNCFCSSFAGLPPASSSFFLAARQHSLALSIRAVNWSSENACASCCSTLREPRNSKKSFTTRR